MEKTFEQVLEGYQKFKEKYADSADSLMHNLAEQGQKPETMVIACSDSRVDPALLLQCDPGDLFSVRNVANIVPPYEQPDVQPSVGAALEFGICYLNVKHLVIMGHSQCGGIQGLLKPESLKQNDFIGQWVSQLDGSVKTHENADEFAQQALLHSYQNCLSFPWIKERVEQGRLKLHLWFFHVKSGGILQYSFEDKLFKPL